MTTVAVCKEPICTCARDGVSPLTCLKMQEMKQAERVPGIGVARRCRNCKRLFDTKGTSNIFCQSCFNEL